jgi:hypothetical protein
MADLSEEVNWGPLSVVMVCGVPKWDIQLLKRAEAQAAAVVDVCGNAFSQHVFLSMMVSMCVQPWKGVKGPTMSMCMCEDHVVGIGISCGFILL